MAWYWWVAIVIGVLWLIGTLNEEFGIGEPRSPDRKGTRARNSAGPIIIGVGSAPRAPSLSPELEQYVTLLVGLFNRQGSLQSSSARELGQEIHEKYGHSAMVDVCDTVRNRVGHTGYRQLEICWSGIGQWQG